MLPEDPRLSRWTLSTRQLNQDWEFNWLAQNLTPTRHQKIHWRSVQVNVRQLQLHCQLLHVTREAFACAAPLVAHIGQRCTLQAQST